jgi:hypothetical protein
MFLKFLVDNKVISEENLLEAVIIQYESMPSLLRVLKDEDLFDSSKLFSLLLESISSRSTIFDLLKKEGRLTPDDLNSLINSQNACATSLACILAERGFVDREKFDLALRDYSKLEKVDPIASEPMEEVKSIKESEKAPKSAPAGISAAALESLKAVGGFDEDQIAELEGKIGEDQKDISHEEPTPDEGGFFTEDKEETSIDSDPTDLNNTIVVEYLDFYSEDKQSELLVIANRFRLKGREKDLTLLNESLTQILSLCKLCNFNIQLKLLEAYETLFSQALNDPSIDNLDWRPEPFSLLELLWDFRKKIDQGLSEIEILSDANFKSNYMEKIKKILNYSKRSA